MNASVTTIAGIVRRSTLLVFLCAVVIGSGTFFLVYNAATMRHVEDEARTLLGIALAARAYTVEQITPLLEKNPDGEFHREQVPSFAAQAIFKRFVGNTGDYSYREVALNPTNPVDRANTFESELITGFRKDPALKEVTGIRDHEGDPLFYIARPIVIRDPACLVCHSTPDKAPRAMVQIYGDTNGFGWTEGETIGVQLLTVPIEQERRSIYELVAVFLAMLVVLFLFVSVMVTVPLQRHVIRPLQQLSDVAERSSLREEDEPLPQTGAREIQRLSQAISRLRTSLSLAMRNPSDPK
ncbi:DUF3365 domain-containing protein [Candidatus Accumulibacter sp. ACC003]|uniref:Tll0287-like domain-containing protein n=1 Tax=Candidatus Accumulibacter sp. ACC003 TaxID=2823334 RepID=UPI0025C263E9|nr:DUF3365 domain-containing protein [Candidatus Accumulibacter sp. ACC003]